MSGPGPGEAALTILGVVAVWCWVVIWYIGKGPKK